MRQAYRLPVLSGAVAIYVRRPRLILQGSTLVGILAVLEGSSRGHLVSDQLLPPVSTIGKAFVDEAQHQVFWLGVGRTLQEWIIGLGLAVLAGVVAGGVIGSNNYLYLAFRPIIEFLRPIPEVALLPLIVLFYGLGVKMVVVLVIIGAFWPMLLQALYGVRDVSPVLRDTAAVYQFGLVRRVWYVVMPSTAPYIATGLRLSAVTAINVAVAAGVIVGAPGLGSMILDATNAGQMASMYALLFTAGLLGVLINIGVRRLEGRFLAWHPSQRGDVPR